MSLIKFLNLQTGNSIIDQILLRLKAVLEEIQAKPILDGVLVENISLSSSGVNLVPHKLGRVYRGYIVVLQSTNSVIYDDNVFNIQKEKFLGLQCSSSVIVSIWFF